MADITVTAANVAKVSGATTETGTAGATITAGKSVYKRNSDSKWLLAQCDGTDEEAGSAGVGIALNGCSDGQPITVLTAGDITIGATVVAGTCYFVSATAGGICPHADLVTGNRARFLGIGSTTGIIKTGPLIATNTIA